MPLKNLMPLAEQIAAQLIARRETIAVAEGSAGGLIAASLLAVPGASAYFLGGAIVYTRTARSTLLKVTDTDMAGMRPATEPYAAMLAERVRDLHGAHWGLSETGASGPTGNPYGDAAGHTCIGVAGPAPRTTTLETGRADRQTNMEMFAMRALELLADATAR